MEDDARPTRGLTLTGWALIWLVAVVPIVVLRLSCLLNGTVDSQVRSVMAGFFCLVFWVAGLCTLGVLTGRGGLGCVSGPGVGLWLWGFSGLGPELLSLVLPLAAILAAVLTAGGLTPAVLLLNLGGYLIYVLLAGTGLALTLGAVGGGAVTLIALATGMGFLNSRGVLLPLLDVLNAYARLFIPLFILGCVLWFS